VVSSDRLHLAWRISLLVLAVGVGWFGWSAYHLVVGGLRDSDPEHMGEGAALGLFWGSLGSILFVVVVVMALLTLVAGMVDVLAPWAEGGAAKAGIGVSLSCIVPFFLVAVFGSLIAQAILANLVGMLIVSIAHLLTNRRPVVAQPPPPKPAGWQPPPPKAPNAAVPR